MASDDRRVFGTCPPGVVCHPRVAAYAVIVGRDGRVAAVRVSDSPYYWLPGGGGHPGETPEATVMREVREELGRVVTLTGRIGEAIQFFHASDESRWYEMSATFFRAELEAEPSTAAEHELCWLDPRQDAGAFFHACHAWAVSRA